MREMVQCVDDQDWRVYNCCMGELANIYIDKIDQKTRHNSQQYSMITDSVWWWRVWRNAMVDSHCHTVTVFLPHLGAWRNFWMASKSVILYVVNRISWNVVGEWDLRCRDCIRIRSAEAAVAACYKLLCRCGGGRVVARSDQCRVVSHGCALFWWKTSWSMPGTQALDAKLEQVWRHSR